MPPSRNRGSHDPLAGSLFLLESAMLDRSRQGATRASLEASNAVAAAYWRAGRYPEARELLERVLADCRAALGPRDPDTLVVEGNLAVTHICLEHFERGLDLLVGNVEARAAVLGDTHPHTMVARHALATAYHMADLLPDALALFAGVAAQRARTLGPAHPDALVSRIGLALARIDSGDDAGAVAVLAAALQRRRAVGRAPRRAHPDDPQQPRARSRGARPPRPGARRAGTGGDRLPDPAGGEPPRHGRPARGPRAALAQRPRIGGAGRALSWAGEGRVAIRPHREGTAHEAGPPRAGPGMEGTTPGGPGPGATPGDGATLPAGTR